MASNVLAYANKEDQYEDWIELYNAGDQSVDLSGYYLSVDPNEKWQIPSGTIINSKGFILFFADGNTYLNFHTSFKLNKEGGKLTLSAQDGITVIDYLEFPEQIRDISFGRWEDGGKIWNYMQVISPGTVNKPGYSTFTGAPVINVTSGFYEGKIQVSINPSSANEIIRYTTDGSDPREISQEYQSPFEVYETCILKARSFRIGSLPGEITSKSILINEQQTLPLLSLIIDPKNLYDPSIGIYNHDLDGRAYERFAEVEYFPKSGLAFHQPCGIRIQGNTGPLDFRKKSFRLFF